MSDTLEISQRELLPLYNWAKSEFAAVEERNKCQDDAIHELGLQTSTAVATMNALVREVQADRRERDASLTIIVAAAVKGAIVEERQLNKEQFGRLTAENKSSIETLKACTERHDNMLQEHAIEIAGHVTRKDFIEFKETTNKKIEGEGGIDEQIKRLESAPGRTALKTLGIAGGAITTAYVVPHIPAAFEWALSIFRHKGGG